jgi:hypothetical protein
MYIYISLGEKISIVFFKLKMVIDGEQSFEMQSKVKDFKAVSDIQPTNLINFRMGSTFVGNSE